MFRELLAAALCVGCGNVVNRASDAGSTADGRTSDGPIADGPSSDGRPPDGPTADAQVPMADVLGGTLRTGCVVALHMDEASWSGAAGEVTDDCGNDNSGTAVGTGTSTVATGVHGRAGSFSGAGCVEIPNAAALHGTTGLTLSTWMFPTQLDGGVNNANGLISKRNDTADQPEYSLSVWTGFRVYVDLDTANDRFASPSVISTNVWTQVTLVYDGTRAVDERTRVYLNGSLDATHAETSASLTPYTSALHVGCTPAPASGTQQGFVGKLDEVVIWNRALSETEVTQWYVNTKP